MTVYLKLFFAAVLWGGTFIAGKVIAGSVGPFSAAFLRFALASVLLLLLTWKAERRLSVPTARQWFPLFLLGMTGVFSYNVFFFNGLRLIEAGRASLIIANNPIFIALFAALFFREKLGLVKIAGVLISVTGAMVVISKGDPGLILHGGLGRGDLFIFCCVASWVAYSLIGKTVMNELSPLASVSWSAAIGALALFLPACFEGLAGDISHYRVADWLSIFYLGFFGTVLGFVWYYEGILKIGPMRAGQFINFVPVSAIVLAFFILDEPITPSLLTGAALVISGVYLTHRGSS